MTELTLNLEKDEITRKYITHLLDQLNIDYKNSKQERKEIASLLVNSEDNFNILEEIELLTVDIRGYASQIQVQTWIDNAEEVIKAVQAIQFFENPTISQFYWKNNDEYPQLKAYIRTLDYLRLLVIRYLLSMLQSGK